MADLGKNNIVNLSGIPKERHGVLIWRRGDQRYRAKFSGVAAAKLLRRYPHTLMLTSDIYRGYDIDMAWIVTILL